MHTFLNSMEPILTIIHVVSPKMWRCAFPYLSIHAQLHNDGRHIGWKCWQIWRPIFCFHRLVNLNFICETYSTNYGLFIEYIIWQLWWIFSSKNVSMLHHRGGCLKWPSVLPATTSPMHGLHHFDKEPHRATWISSRDLSALESRPVKKVPTYFSALEISARWSHLDPKSELDISYVYTVLYGFE